MRVIYNGVDLGVVETYHFDCTSVYDDSGVDYLYTLYSMAFRCVVNGQAEVVNGRAPGPFMSYASQPELRGGVRGGSPRGAPLGSPLDPVAGVNGTLTPPSSGIDAAVKSRYRQIVRVPSRPILTHEAVRFRLNAPRGKLWVFEGYGAEANAAPDGESIPVQAEVLLECPDPGMACDAKNGPTPKVLGLPVVMGEAEAFFVDWACEAYVVEAGDSGVGSSGVLLSNRFAQTQLVDQAGWTTVVTGGVAVFRTDFVYNLPETPDAKRPLLHMPIPQGFVRENIQVHGRPDVTGVEYSYQDRQVPVNFPAGPYARCASISAVHRQAITSDMDVLEGALSAYERVLNIAALKNWSRGDHAAPGPARPGVPGPGSAINRPASPTTPRQMPFRPGMRPPAGGGGGAIGR